MGAEEGLGAWREGETRLCRSPRALLRGAGQLVRAPIPGSGRTPRGRTSGLGAVVAAQVSAAPGVGALEVDDATFAAGAPFDQATERSGVLVGAARLGGLALAGDGHASDAEVAEGGGVVAVAVAAVGRQRSRRLPGPPGDLLHAAPRLGRIGAHRVVAALHGVVDDDAVDVVDHLRLITELHGLAQPLRGDGAAHPDHLMSRHNGTKRPFPSHGSGNGNLLSGGAMTQPSS